MSDAASTFSGGLAGAAGMFGAVATLNAEHSQIDAMRANARYYETQAEYSRKATERELEIFEHEVDDVLGRQVSGYGKSGVDLSGSPMLLIGQTKERAAEELEAIKERGRQNVELTLMRARTAQAQADDLMDASFDHFGLNLFTSALGAGNAAARGKSSASVANRSWEDTGAGTAASGGEYTWNPKWRGVK